MLLPDKAHRDVPTLATSAVFPEKDSLPSAEAKAATTKGDNLGRTSKRHLNVAGHIIGAFKCVSKIRVVFGHKPVDKSF